MSYKREVLTLFIGQAGVQLGSALWELFSIEHGVGPDGILPPDHKSISQDGFWSIFSQSYSGKFSPNAFFVDLEPSVIDEIINGKDRGFFNPLFLEKGKEDSANNYARGYLTVGDSMLPQTMKKIRNFVERSDNFQGVIAFRSVGGGTGSGFGSLILNTMTEEHMKKNILDICVYPAPEVATSVVEPYNAILTSHTTMDDVDCSFILDNEALYKICKEKLDIDRPIYKHINNIVAQAVSSVTASLRFDGPLNVDLGEFQTNLVPFPRVHFPVISYAPIRTKRRAGFENNSVLELTRACFHPSHQMVNCDLRNGKYMACCLLYRGDVVPKDVNSAITFVKQKKMARFVDWSPTGFKIGINSEPPSVLPKGSLAESSRAVCMICNTTSVTAVWARINAKFDLMYSKRAFIHWYVAEGLDEEIFSASREALAAVERDYEIL